MGLFSQGKPASCICRQKWTYFGFFFLCEWTRSDLCSSRKVKSDESLTWMVNLRLIIAVVGLSRWSQTLHMEIHMPGSKDAENGRANCELVLFNTCIQCDTEWWMDGWTNAWVDKSNERWQVDREMENCPGFTWIHFGILWFLPFTLEPLTPASHINSQPPSALRVKHAHLTHTHTHTNTFTHSHTLRDSEREREESYRKSISSRRQITDRLGEIKSGMEWRLTEKRNSDCYYDSPFLGGAPAPKWKWKKMDSNTGSFFLCFVFSVYWNLLMYTHLYPQKCGFDLQRIFFLIFKYALCRFILAALKRYLTQ